MKQTAVEWLAEKLRTEFGFAFSNNILEQAKEMEKQQIIEAHLNGQAEFDKGPYRSEIIKNSEQYYKKTLKNK